MKILFIGGTGILSRDTVDYALKKGYDVYILNRGKNNQSLDPRCHVLISDIRKAEMVREAIQGIFFDVVVDYLSYTLEQLKGTLSIFNRRCKQFVFISSATVYQRTKENEVFSEEASKKGNTSWKYAYNKYECEQYLQKNYQSVGQIYTIVRPYITYGNTRFPYALIPQNQQWSLAQRILNGKAIPVWNDGGNICTLTHTRDFAVGIVGLFGNEKAFNEDFHITSGMEYTWRDIIKETAKALGREANIIEIPLTMICKITPEYEGILCGDKATDMRFDNSKIHNAVPEFHCKIGFQEGIKDTIENYQNHKNLQVVNYFWDGRMDYLIAKSGKGKKYGCPQNIGTRAMLDYYQGRYLIFSKAFGACRKLKKLVKRG